MQMNEDDPCTCTMSIKKCQVQKVDNVVEPSTRRLENWKKWLEARRNVHKKMKSKLNRKPGDLVMNIGDDYKFLSEEKEIHRVLNVTLYKDKWRGCPTFFTLPDSLQPDSDNPHSSYFAVMTKEKKKLKPIIEYVTVPDYIKKEKDVVPYTRQPLRILWQNSPYRQQKVLTLEKKLKCIEPHKPKLDELIVIGKGYKEPQSCSVEKSTEVTKLVSIVSLPKVSEVQKFTYSLNGINITSYIKQDIKIELKFEVARNSKKLQTQFVNFQSLGTAALRFTFTKVEKFKLFKDIHITEPQVVFHFNKNMFILLPGKKIEFPIWVKYHIDGAYDEIWKITTQPNVTGNSNVYLILKYETFVENFDEMSYEIKYLLDKRIKYRIVNDIVSDLSDFTKYKKSKIATYKYAEEQIFQSINYDTNLNYGGVKYIYDKEVVKELKDFYEGVKQDKDPAWNLSINELKRVTRIRDLLCYEEKMKRLKEVTQMKNEELKLKRKEDFLRKMAKSDSVEKTKPKPSDKSSKTAAESDNKKAKSSEKIKASTLETTNFIKLNAILRKLKKPEMIKNTEREKYYLVFCIIKACFSKMCFHLREFENSMDSINYSNYSSYYCPNRIHDLPERVIFERFDNTFKYINFCNPPVETHAKDKPKPENLQQFDVDDVENIYNTYFGTTSKTKLVQADPKGKQTDKLKYNPAFDPYAEEFIPTEPDLNLDSDEEGVSLSSFGSSSPWRSSFHKKHFSNYELNLYVIIYTYLEEAVKISLEMIDSFEDYVVPELVLREIKQEERTITSIEYANLLKKQVKLPKEKTDLLVDESVQNYLIKGITKPTTSDDSISSLWSIYRSYTPVSSMSSIHVQTTEETSSLEVHIKDADVQTVEQFSPLYNISQSSLDKLNEVVCEEVNASINVSADLNQDEYYYSDDENFHLLPLKGKKEESIINDTEESDVE